MLRRQAEQSLYESEARFRQIFDTALTGNFMALADGRLLMCNPAFVRLFGFQSTDQALELGINSLFKDRRSYEAFLRLLKQDTRLQDHELWLRNIQGESLIVHASVVAEFGARSAIERFEGCFLDITARKRAEAAKRNLARRLAEVQELERARFSRELHDQTGQEIAGLQLHLKSLADDSTLRSDVRRRLTRLRGLTEHLAKRIHQIAWELRPSVLDDLGLDKALRRYTSDWSELSRVRVEYQSSGLTGCQRTDPMLEITLYRIAQEALHNVWKHGRARQVSVLLQRRRREILLIIEDNGQGFNVETVVNSLPQRGKLGFLGMRERASLVGGTVNVESTPGQGTAVFVSVPLPSRGPA